MIRFALRYFHNGVNQKLRRLRELMANFKIEGYIIPHNDAHFVL